MDRGRRDEALIHARESIRIASSKEGFELLGDLHWHRQEGKAALSQYRKSFAAGPTSAVLGKLCLALVENRVVPDAVKRCQNAVNVQPQNATLRFFLGVALGMGGKPVEGLASLKMAVQMDPGNALFQREYERARHQLPAPLR